MAGNGFDASKDSGSTKCSTAACPPPVVRLETPELKCGTSDVARGTISLDVIAKGTSGAPNGVSVIAKDGMGNQVCNASFTNNVTTGTPVNVVLGSQCGAPFKHFAKDYL